MPYKGEDKEASLLVHHGGIYVRSEEHTGKG